MNRPAAAPAAVGARRRARRQSAAPAGVVAVAASAAACSRVRSASVTPSPDSVTLREHVSFVELPDNNYQPALTTIRAPATAACTFVDYSTPIGEPMQFRYVRRHRLQKKDPTAAVSEAVKPIQYWVDSGAPEDVKKALVEGASWWNAGVRGGRLPQRVQGRHPARRRRSDGHSLQHDQLGAPLDARLEHRRVGLGPAHRRDHQGHGHARLAARPPGLHDLRGPAVAVRETNGNERPSVLYETALQRIRQLSAHEVGHTLGLGHNYYDSSKGWISVMDYPHPLEHDPEGGRHASTCRRHTTAQNIGDWDKVAINYGYREFASGSDETVALTKILDDAWAADLKLLHQPGHRHPPACRAVVERRQPGRRADAPDEACAGSALEPHRREHHPHRRGPRR